MSKDTIYRQDAIDAFKKELTVGESKGNYVTICSAIGYEGAKQILESLSPAQPEREKGKWIEIPDDPFAPIVVCSRCSQTAMVSHGEYQRTRYCPYCGAYMREGEKDEIS